MIGPNEVSINDASCITPLLGALGCPKGPSELHLHGCRIDNCTQRRHVVFNGRHLWPKIPSVIGFRDPAIHQQRRRPWNRAFNTAALKEYQPKLQARLQQLVDALEERQGQVVDLAQWIGFFTYVSFVPHRVPRTQGLRSDTTSWETWCKSVDRMNDSGDHGLPIPPSVTGDGPI